MHLKTLTLRGFKSFASSTTLRFEPGITCVVGPNGSGKSNVADALAWVMGEQGAKTLRGGKMEDVIFAGTTGSSGRPALGRAEVTLTIDNSDGALPIGYAEVSISRTMFRSGGSEYAINGAPARLLDVAELLSDSGIGREMHVIVGQGQLDSILHAGPEERRGFVEEAAGVLKHRKRKERALRKLDAMAVNLTRLADLSAEVRRQLGPLARQADVARRAQVVAAQVRDARGRLLADDLVQAQALLTADLADADAHRARRGAVEAALTAARSELGDAERASTEVAPALAAAQESYFALHSLRERLRSTSALAAERERNLRPLAAPAALGGPARRDLDTLIADARRAREAEANLAELVTREEGALAGASAERAAAEAALAAHERSAADAARARADARERVGARSREVASRRSRAEAAAAEAERTGASLAQARERAARAQEELASLSTQARSDATATGDGDASAAGDGDAAETALAQASAALADADADLARWRDAERDAERDRAGAAARVEALEMGLRERRDGTGALLAHGGHLPGVLGPFASLLTVAPGAEDVVAAALGAAADAVAVESVEAAVDALRMLHSREAGRAELVMAQGGGGPVPGDDPSDPTDPIDTTDLPVPGSRPLLELVSAPPHLSATLTHLLARHVAVPGLAEARALVAARPDVVAVTEAGDVLHSRAARGGTSTAAGGAVSRLHVEAALEETRRSLAEATARSEHARKRLSGADAAARARREQLAEASAALAERDAAAASAARAVGEASGAARGARAEADRLDAATAKALAAAGVAAERLAEAEAALAGVQAQLALVGIDDGDADAAAERGAALAAAAASARGLEVDARLRLRTAQERARGVAGRAEAAEAAARAERARAEQQAALAARAAASLAVVTAVRTGAEAALAVARQALLSAGLRRDDAETDAAATSERLAGAREEVDRLAEVLAGLTDSVHRDELARAQRSARLEALRARAVEELAIDPDVLVDELGPDRPVDGSAPYVRSEQEARLRTAERDLAKLGKVNPLALEEYAALEERSAFLTRQLDDLRTARADLLDIVREVDERVQEVFASAFADTAAEFEGVFARLFPGGEGRLVLTDPDDLLTSGIDVEARPAGKRVKRLSLLSGGERSLTAVALLVAIFRARPSPFYVLDEVEAALDDANLRRLLVVLGELRASSQLIVITHQERTMEIADALYGVSMRADGVSAVVSQRLVTAAAR